MTTPILYVEDEEDYQILVRRILARAGYELSVAETGHEAMDKLQERRPSLLLLDINLPDTSGYAICEQLRQDPAYSDLPILMLTVRRRPEEWLMGFQCGTHDYVSKPLNPPELLERVAHCLKQKPQPPAGKAAEFRLIQAAADGNRGAFQILIQKYRERLMCSLRNSIRNEAQLEDAVAHAFAAAYEQLGAFRGDSSFYTWIYRMARNESISEARRPPYILPPEQTRGSGDRLLFGGACGSKPIETVIAEKETRRRVRSVMRRLPPPFRQILVMFCLEDLSYKRIAKELHIPHGTVMSRLFNARFLFQQAWKGKKPLPRKRANC